MSLLGWIWQAALALAAVAILWMLLLIGLRVFHQRREARRLADRRKVDAALVGLLQGRCDLQRDLAPFARRARLIAEALLDFLGLVRGHDREIVLAALIELGVPQVLCARLRSGSVAGRMVCLEALAAFPGEATEEALREALESASPEMRLTALRSLYETRRDLPLGSLLAELETGRLRPSATVGEFVRTLVAEIPATAAAELRGGLLPPDVQLLVIDGLASAGDYGAVPTLISLASHGATEVRAAALRALGALNHPAAEGAVAQGLRDAEWPIRAAAAEAAGAIGLSKLANELAGRMEDPVWRVRFLAAGALSRLGVAGRTELEKAAAGPAQIAAETAALALAEQGRAP